MKIAEFSLQQLLAFFKALASEKRQEILFTVFLDGKKHSVGEVAERVSIAASTASEHLSHLKRVGILTSVKVAKVVYYRANREYVLALLDEVRDRLACC